MGIKQKIYEVKLDYIMNQIRYVFEDGHPIDTETMDEIEKAIRLALWEMENV